MTVIELPDEQAAALKAKAEAQGLTLEAWLKNWLTTKDAASPLDRPRRQRPTSSNCKSTLSLIPLAGRSKTISITADPEWPLSSSIPPSPQHGAFQMR